MSKISGLVVFSISILSLVFLSPAGAQPLGSGSLAVAGTGLVVGPESQTVPFDTSTVVTTTLEGYDPQLGPLPFGLRVRGDLRGPEIDGVLSLEAIPGQPLRIPRLRLEGEYVVENIRLVDGDVFLSYATPRSVVLQVTEVLVTRVSSRPLTLDEIRAYGIVIGDDSFQMFRFVFGFGIDGEEIVVEFPVSAGGVFVLPGARGGGDFAWRPPTSRFRPPQLVPFSLDLPQGSDPTLSIPHGGCPPAFLRVGCRQDFSSTPLVGVIAIPTDVALLHQFFSVILMVQNGAPEGDPLVLRDLAARVTLPPSLRQAETLPATPLGVPVPIRMPGPDGEVGTGDDVTFLVAQAEGEAEFLLEGLVEGSHVVRFDIDGVLDGLPSGPRAVSGEALGAVVVRDPHLQVTINHPEVVRTDEAYAMYMTVANIGPAPTNLVSFTLPSNGLSGVDVTSESTQTIEQLLPGESETVRFDMVATRTGRVIASTVRTGSNLDPVFTLSAGISSEGIPLSPNAIVLSDRVTRMLPEDITRPALSLAGLGYSLATARPADLPPTLPLVENGAVISRFYRLAQAAHHVEWGEAAFDTLAILAAEWQGARDGDPAWDGLRRISGKGRALAAGLGAVFEAESMVTSPRSMAERFYAATGFLPAHALVMAAGAVDFSLQSQANGLEASGLVDGESQVRDLPFAELYPVGTDATLGLITRLEAGGYRARLEATVTGLSDIDVLLPDLSGGLRAVRWSNVSMTAGDIAEVAFTASDTSFMLNIDRSGDGVFDDAIMGQIQTVTPRAFEVVAARQNTDVDPTGHVVDVLFTRDVDRATLAERQPSRFQIDGLVSDGGVLSAGEVLVGSVSASGTLRMVRVLFDNPIGFVDDDLLVTDIRSVGILGAGGDLLGQQVVRLDFTQMTPGGVVEGTVIGSDGQPVPFALVELFEHDSAVLRGGECVEHKTGAVRTDAAGRFHFPFVRSLTCDGADRFRLAAFDPSDLAHGDAIGRVRFPTETTELNVVMIGRGRVEGRVTYKDGSVPTGLEVRVFNPVFEEGRLAHVTADGRFDANDIMVGTVEISANDDAGLFVFATVELSAAGEIATSDLEIIRTQPDPTGQVRGTATNADGSEVLVGAILALYVKQVFVGTTTSGVDGRFDFGAVLTGTAEIEIFDPDTAVSGGRVFFEIATDQVVDIAVALRDARATVEGLVQRQRVDGTVVPVSGAIVFAEGQQANTVSGADGSYRLEGVLAGDQIRIRAADPQTLERVSSAVGSVIAGDTLELGLLFIEQIEVAGAIIGQVLDWNGDEIAGALVHVANGLEGATRWSFEAVTDAMGRFVLRGTALTPSGEPVDIGLEPGTYSLHAIAGAAGAVASAEIQFPGDTPSVTLQLKRGTVRVRTAVRQSNGTESGIVSQVQFRPTVVEFGLVRGAYSPILMETNVTGDLIFSDVLIGPYELFVSNAFHGERLIRNRLTTNNQENVHDIVFEDVAGAVRGRVLDYDGVTPVAEAQVVMRVGALGTFDVSTDAEGRYAFELVPISGFDMVATIDGAVFRTARTRGSLSRGGQVIEDADIILPRQGAVIGLVEDADTARVPGAVVTLNEHAYPHRRMSATADQDGNFSFENVIAGGFAVSAQAPSLGGLGGRSSGLIEHEGQVVGTVIKLEPTAEIIGHVFSPVDGSPVASARVRLVHGGSLVEAIDSDEHGAFRFRLLPLRNYRVRAFDPTTGRFGESASVTPTANGELVTSDVTLQVRGEVAGQVVEPEGLVAIPGATVRLRSQTPFFHLETLSSTDILGEFLFGGIPEGDFMLSVREPGGRRRAEGSGTIGMEDERVTVDLILEAFGSVRGSILQPPGLLEGLFPNGNVRLIGPNDLLIAASLDNPFVLDGVLPGERFTLRAQELGGTHRGVVHGRMPPEGDASGGIVDLDITMVALGQVVVSVVDSFGNPVPNAEVSFTGRGELGWDVRAASTGADNRVSFTQVAAGSLSVRARDVFRDLRGAATGQLSLEGESVALTVRLEDTGFVQGQVLLSDGMTPTSDVVIALKEGSDFRFAQAAADGTFAFEAVPVGAWTLSVQEELGLGRFEAIGSIVANGEVDDLGQIVLDDEDPRLISVAPASGDRDIPIASSITVTFSEPIDVARWRTDSVIVRAFDGGNQGMSTAWNAEQTTVTLTPTTALQSATLYEIFVTTRVVDRAGRAISETVRSTFTTRDVVAPAVIDIVPRDGENQIPVISPILITFSEPVVFGSLSAALSLFDLTTGTGVTTTFHLRPSGREVTLTAAFGLVADRQYRVTVQGVADASGNAMPTPLVTTFWTVDKTLPVGSFLTPEVNDSFTAGDLIDGAVIATDNRGVASVTFRIGDGSFEATDVGGDRYEASFPAPRVATTSDFVLEAEIIDIFGNSTVLSRTVQVVPRVNANGPTVTAPCLYQGDQVRPGRDLLLPFTVHDDEGIERYVLWVDDALQTAVTHQHLSEITDTFTWTMPVTALPGVMFTVRLEATDYAGNVGAYEVEVKTPPDLVFAGDVTLDATMVDGRDVALADGTFTVTEALEPKSLAVLPGATVVGVDGGSVEVVATNDLRVQCGGAIDVTGQGYAAGVTGSPLGHAPAGIAPSEPDAGGSHGGLGIANDGPGPAGETYGSVYAPRLGGGGGALASASETGSARAGGGAVHLKAAEVVLGGDIVARGDGRNGPGHDGQGGAGAGGSIWIETDALRGAGTIDASGDDYTWCSASFHRLEGAGGGGRIALDVGALDRFDPTIQARAQGGQLINTCFDGLLGIAGAGTVYVRTAADPYGTLHADGGAPRAVHGLIDGLDPAPTPLPELVVGTVDSAVVEGSDLRVTVTPSLRDRWLGAWMRLEAGDGTSLGSFRVIALDAVGAVLEGASTVTGAVTYAGEYRFDRVVTRNRAQVIFASPWTGENLVIADDATISGAIAADSLRLATGTTLRAAIGHGLQLDVAGLLTVEAGAVIDADGAGLQGLDAPGTSIPGMAPGGLAGATHWAGASHGGRGQRPVSSIGEPNETYGSVYWPRHAGASTNSHVGDGGGVITITAGEITLDGTLRARGEGFHDDTITLNGSAGAGGSVLLATSELRGAGLVDVSGGSWHRMNDAAGAVSAGGGGRAALYVGTFEGFVIATQVRADGGLRSDGATTNGYAGPGTIFVFHGSSDFSTLRVIQTATDAESLPETALPTIGVGTVGSVTADTTTVGAAWVTDASSSPFALGVEGAWLRIDGIDYRILEQSSDRMALLLEGADGFVSVGDAYQGVWKFDQVVVDGGATLVFGDPPQVTTFEIGNGTVVQPVGEWLSPSAGQSFEAGSSIHAEVDTGTNPIDRVIYHFDGGVFTDTSAPFVADIPAPTVGISTDFTLRAEIVDDFGNVNELTREITITPHANAVAPIVDVPCHEAGDYVRPGVALALSMTGVDDEAIERFALLVDDEVIESSRFGVDASVSADFLWTPPSDAMPDQDFVVRVEATDYAGNVGVWEATVRIPAGLVLTGGGSLDAASVAGLDVAVADGAFTVTEALAPMSLAVLPGATVVGLEGAALAIAVTNDLRVQCGGAIDVTGQGYAGAVEGSPFGQAPIGVAPSEPDAGGSHGGLGISYDNVGPAGEIYGSIYEPTHGGGGGALKSTTDTGFGQAGGGVVRLVADQLIVGGEVLARGQESSFSGRRGGGAGGSIWIEATLLRGGGSIDASGSDTIRSCNNGDGAGGGGRIAFDVGSFDGFDPAAQALAHGGQIIGCFNRLGGIAGPGTVYARTASSIYGDLHVDAGSPRATVTVPGGFDPPLTTLPEMVAGVVNNAVVEGSDLRVTVTPSLRDRWLGAWMRLEAGDGTSLGSFRVIALDAAGAVLEGASTVTGAVTYAGEYRFDRVVTRNRAQVIFASPWTGENQLIADDATIGGAIVADSLRLVTGTTLRAAVGHRLQLDVAGLLTVEAGAVIDADGVGLQGLDAPGTSTPGMAPGGLAGATHWAGASHGGRGQRPVSSIGEPNETYGSVYWPRHGGASTNSHVGDGGGVIAITAGEITLDGTLRARGEGLRADPIASNGSAGAGGSVLLATSVLRGAGTVDVSGGSWHHLGATAGAEGAGGGGRAALYVDDFDGFVIATQVRADGGLRSDGATTNGYAGPGTIFVFHGSSDFSTLRVIQTATDAVALPETALPTIGVGTVGSVTADSVDATDVWIDDTTGRTFSFGVDGMWLRVLGSDFRVIGQSADRTQLLIEDAAGLIAVGDGFGGVYKFDRVVVDRGALVFGDLDDVGLYEVTGGGSVVAPIELDPPVITNVLPADQSVVIRGETIDFTAEASDASGIEQVTLAIDGLELIDDTAPYAWQWTAPWVNEATTFAFTLTASDTLGNRTMLTRTIQVTPGAAPTIVSVTPAEGTVFSPGDAIDIAANVVADATVTSVTFTFDNVSFVDLDAPFDWSVVAPSVEVGTDFVIGVDTVDVQQLHATLARTIRVEPGIVVPPPTLIGAGCVRHGTPVLGGTVLPIEFTLHAPADDTITSWSVVADTVEIAQATGLSETVVQASATWTVPAAASAGSSFVVRIQAATAAGGLLSEERTVTVPQAYLSGPLDLDATSDGQDLLLGPGDYAVIEALAPASLRLMDGAHLLGQVGTALEIDASVEIVLACGAAIDMTGTGYPGGDSSSGVGTAPDWITPADTNAGGSHGGVGSQGDRPGLPPEIYGSVYVPATAGSGGRAYTSDIGGAGGGVVRVSAPEIVVDGAILSRGQDRIRLPGNGTNDRDGAGAGGSIRVEAGTLRGFGTVDASGGDYQHWDLGTQGGGAGGGGRIVLAATNVLDFDVVAHAHAYGGEWRRLDGVPKAFAGPGTVLAVAPADTWGTLILDAGFTAPPGLPVPLTPLPRLDSVDVSTVDDQPEGLWLTSTSAFLPRWLGVEVVAYDSIDSVIGTFRALDTDAAGRLLLATAGAITTPARVEGWYRFDGLQVRGHASIDTIAPMDAGAIEIGPGVSYLPSSLTGSALRLQTGAQMKALTGSLDIAVAGAVTLEAGASIDVSHQGFPGGTASSGAGTAPDWITEADSNAGGSHGGMGSPGDRPGVSPEVYGSVYAPRLMGSGGRAYASDAGGAGGGVVRIAAAEIVLDGEILARGEDRIRLPGNGTYERDGAGAGGSIHLEAGTVRGSGSLDASGGDYQHADNGTRGGGAGGGGRIVVAATAVLDFDAVTHAHAYGGVWRRLDGLEMALGGPGTTLVVAPGDTWGSLHIDGGYGDLAPPLAVPTTPLPPLGSGVVTAVEAVGSDLWITAAATFYPRWRGVEVALADATSSELGRFRVLDVSTDGRLLVEGAGSMVASVLSFEGHYRFDSVTSVGGGSTSASALYNDGPITLGHGDHELPNDLVATELHLGSGAQARPALDAPLSLNVSGTLTIEAGAVIDVSGSGFAGGVLDPAGKPGDAPSWVAASGVLVGGSHGGEGIPGFLAAEPVGEPYGSCYVPSLGGGGGGSSGSKDGGRGGGVLSVDTAELVLDGTLRARGADAFLWEGAGAAGTVVVRAGVLRGLGTIDARGGDNVSTSSAWGGAGGGGRVSLLVDDLSGFDPQSQVLGRGGRRTRSGTVEEAAPGTVYALEMSDTWGRLFVAAAADSPSVAATTLPILGSGTVSLAEPDGSDLWLTAPTTFHPRWQGAWIELFDGLAVSLGRFSVVAVDVLGRVRVADASSHVASTASYQGIYRFDTVTELHGATVTSTDPMEVTTP